MPPIAGHHIQCTLRRPQKCSNPSSKPYINLLRPAEARPTNIPSGPATASVCPRGIAECSSTGKIGPAPCHTIRNAPAATLATATGTRERGRHSKSNNSTANKIAARGAANVADIPAAAPATSSVVRSAALSLSHCATSDPNAPPVMMIGPSAPKGPPDPIAMAAESGFSTATLGSTRAPRNRIASIASGIPCPRILSEP